jgi:S-adenosylhomocysteine hydrolase
MKKVKVGCVIQQIGYFEMEIPKNIKKQEEILNYIYENHHKYGLPKDLTYIDDSFEVDSINGKIIS